MHAYLLRTQRRLAPFDEHPRDLPILGQPLGAYTRDRLTEARCTISEIDDLDEVSQYPCLLLHDDLYLSPLLLRDFLRAASGAGRMALGPSAWVRHSGALQDLPELQDGTRQYPLWRLDSPADIVDLDAVPDVVLGPSEWVRPMDLPAVFARTKGPKPELILSSRRAVRVRHWAHLLRINTDAIGGLFREAWDRSKARSLIRLGLVFLIRPFFKRALIPRGRGCKIHPTAVVEACQMGANVRIGAHAIVRGSVLGDGVVVHDGAQVSASVLGDDAQVAPNCVVFASLMMRGAFCAHRLTQACVIGRDALTTGGGYLVDLNFEGDVRVMDEGKLRPSGSGFLGVCLGHGVRMGTGIWVAAGRAIPNGLFLVRHQDGVLRRIPADAPAGPPLRVHNGGLIDPDGEPV